MGRAMLPLSALLALGVLVAPSHASSQGLYIMQPTTGTIELVNYTSNARTPVGTGIGALGWEVPSDCSPTAIDTTGKWMYVMARNASGSPWSVVSVELRDGSIRKVYELPSSFPPTLGACEHTITEDGDWHAYVSAAVNVDGVVRLVVWRFTFTWPDSDETVPVLDVPVASLGMGEALPVPISVVTNVTLWVGLSDGLVGVDLATNASSRRLPLPAGSAWSRLQYDISGAVRRTYALSTTTTAGPTGPRNVTAIVSFVDNGSGIPKVESTSTSEPVPPSAVGSVALINDHSAIAVASGGSLITLGLDGTVQSSVPLCVGGTCPIGLAYQPFVF
jgi:hypothetical protein